MVVGAFPAAKLGVLAFKQLSKPIANVIKERAKQSPFFRRYICMPPAQFYNWMEVKTKMWALNLGKPTNVPQLNETMAIELGANLLGEVIIFTLGAGVLIFEYVRQSNNEDKKEKMILQRKMELENTIHDLQFNLERHDAQIRELTRMIADLESRSWLPKKLKILSDKNDSPPPTPPSPSLPSPNYSNLSYSQKTNLSDKCNRNPIDIFENEAFTKSINDKHKYGIIQNALIFLNYNIYE